MDFKKLTQAAKPQKLGGYLARLSRGAAKHHEMHMAHDLVREDEHKGHRIVVRTMYTIEVDGKPLKLPIGVDNEGHVHCHSLPNYMFTSAVDLVKTVIDQFPDEFAPPKPGRERPAKKPARAAAGKPRRRARKGGR
ncbi:MAG: hypothetical protein ACM3U2_15005 [Deltaproteobacteria bacterium]